jgi:hypothetical protein
MATSTSPSEIHDAGSSGDVSYLMALYKERTESAEKEADDLRVALRNALESASSAEQR